MKKKRIIFYIILFFLIFCFYMISADDKPKKENNNIKTDFSKIKELYLIYPEGIKEGDCNYNDLKDFYRKLIEKIPINIELIIFVKSKKIGEKIKDLRTNLRYQVNSELESIWLRDFAGFNMDDKIVKPFFYYEDDSKTAIKINNSMRTLNSLLKKRLVDIDLIWDGGNLVTNGEIGFITERIIEDNKKKYTRKQIEKIIKDTLKIKPVFITELKGDTLAHADGYLAFINENTVLLSEYPDNKFFENDNEYVGEIKEILENLKLKIVRIKDNPVDVKPHCEGIASAKGIYINFLRLNNTIIMPIYKYKIEEDDKYNKLNEKILTDLGFDIITINCDDLAKFGGVLHCISFTN